MSDVLFISSLANNYIHLQIHVANITIYKASCPINPIDNVRIQENGNYQMWRQRINKSHLSLQHKTQAIIQTEKFR